MKFYGNAQGKLHSELSELVSEYRKRRNFNTVSYIKSKTELINEYFRTYRLDTAVIGISGGIDSAVALGLLVQVMKKEDSAIKRIIPLLLPAFDNVGASNQETITDRGKRLCESFNLTPYVFPMLTEAVNTVAQPLESLLGVEAQGWGRGQLVAYQRTPILYYAATLSTENNHPALVVGTTNFDEGGYLGYIGKASDAMVDLQIISDVHKSEVFALAAQLGVTDDILSAIPSGDMYDARVDEEVFGASYDFVELFLDLKTKSKDEVNKTIQSLSAPAQKQYEVMNQNLEDLHRFNHHKYLGRSVAVHLDILPAQIPGGWQNIPWQVPTQEGN